MVTLAFFDILAGGLQGDISKVGDLKAPFPIATTPKCRGGHYSFLWIVPLCPWYIPYNAECKARQHQVPFFESLVWLDMGLNPGLQAHWWKLQLLGQWRRYICTIIVYNLPKLNTLNIDRSLIKENYFVLKKTRSRCYPTETITDTDYTDD